MTQKEFIKKFETVCIRKGIIGVFVKDWECAYKMCFENYQSDEIESDFVSEVGFFDGDFYITFSESICTAYEDELECNSEDAWQLLWDRMLEHFGIEDFDLHTFKPGDAVYLRDMNQFTCIYFCFGICI